MTKDPFIARDTKQPLVVMGHYRVASDGGLIRETLPPLVPGVDYGADPLPDGTFKMVPSGDIVDFAERSRRLKSR